MVTLSWNEMQRDSKDKCCLDALFSSHLFDISKPTVKDKMLRVIKKGISSKMNTPSY